MVTHEVSIDATTMQLPGTLTLPSQPRGIVVFAHGSGSSRFSPRNRFVASFLNDQGFGTLLFDLLTEEEEEAERFTRHLRFDVHLLANRLLGAVDWLAMRAEARGVDIGLFGSSTGAAAAIVAAAMRPERVKAVVSRGGRPDLAGPALTRISCPTLLIVGADDHPVVELNEEALAEMRCEKAMELVPGATHLFEEPGTLDRAAELASRFFAKHLELHLVEHELGVHAPG